MLKTIGGIFERKNEMKDATKKRSKKRAKSMIAFIFAVFFVVSGTVFPTYAGTADYPTDSFQFNITPPQPGQSVTSDSMTWYGMTPPATGSARVYDANGNLVGGTYSCNGIYTVKLSVTLPSIWAYSSYSYLPISLNGNKLMTQRNTNSSAVTYLQGAVTYEFTGGHNLQFVEEVPATCTADGVKAHYECTVCKRKFSDSEGQVPATNLAIPGGHILTHVAAKDPTCTTDGCRDHYKCSVCEKYFSDSGANHELSAAEVIIPKSHKLAHVDAREPSCTQAGCKEHYKCNLCGKYFTDAEGNNEVSSKDVLIPKAHKLFHVDGIEATCTEDGVKEHYECSACGKLFADAQGKTETKKSSLVIEKLDHDWEKIIEKMATTDEEGIINYICRRNPEHTARETFIYRFSGNETVSYGKDAVLSIKRSVNEEETFDLFRSVEVDGQTLEKDCYEAKPGSLIITLNQSFINTLPAGVHKITVNFEDGCVDLTFPLQEIETTEQGNGNIGIVILASALGLLIVASAVIAVVAKRKGQKQ